MTQNTTKPSKKTGWKILYILSLLLVILAQIVIIFAAFEEPWYNIVVPFLVSIFLVTGVYGYAYDQQIISKKFWLYGTIISFAYIAILEFVIPLTDFLSAGLYSLNSIILFSIALSLLLYSLQFWALYRYIYASNNIWQQETLSLEKTAP